MIVVGFILIAAAVAAAVILTVQNQRAINVHALGGSWRVDAYWLLVAGFVILAVAILGLVIAKTAAARVWRLRRERRELARENRRLSAQVDTSTGSVSPPVAAGTSAAGGAETRAARRGLHLRRTALHP